MLARSYGFYTNGGTMGTLLAIYLKCLNKSIDKSVPLAPSDSLGEIGAITPSRSISVTAFRVISPYLSLVFTD